MKNKYLLATEQCTCNLEDLFFEDLDALIDLENLCVSELFENVDEAKEKMNEYFSKALDIFKKGFSENEIKIEKRGLFCEITAQNDRIKYLIKKPTRFRRGSLYSVNSCNMPGVFKLVNIEKGIADGQRIATFIPKEPNKNFFQKCGMADVTGTALNNFTLSQIKANIYEDDFDGTEYAVFLLYGADGGVIGTCDIYASIE